jgi:hypothetical protein
MVNSHLMEKAWKKAERSVFRLEAVSVYKVPEDLLLFEKWKRGKFELDARSKEWLKNLKKTSQRGVKIQRVRVAPLPLSGYIRYEIDFWKNSEKCGEEILFLESKDYGKIIKNLDFTPKDFWMFDDKALIIFLYDGKGNFLREKPISDKSEIKRHAELKRKLLEHAVQMDEFLKGRPNASISSSC